MNRVELNTYKLLERETAHPYLKEMLGFPPYYGANLDALHDCLTQLGPTEVIFADYYAAAETEREKGGFLFRLMRVFNDSAEENPDLTLIIPEAGAADEAEEESAESLSDTTQADTSTWE